MTISSAGRKGAPRRARALVHNRDRESDILVAARAVFEERGFEAASVAEIARRSRVAEGTIYLYSANKRELLHNVVARWYEDLIATIAPGLAAREGARAKLRWFAEAHLAAVGENAPIGRLLVRELRSAEDYRASPLRALNARYTRLFMDILRDGVAAGEILADARPETARDLFFGGLEHLALSGLGAAAKRGAAAESFFRLFWRAVAKTG